MFGHDYYYKFRLNRFKQDLYIYIYSSYPFLLFAYTRVFNLYGKSVLISIDFKRLTKQIQAIDQQNERTSKSVTHTMLQKQDLNNFILLILASILNDSYERHYDISGFASHHRSVCHSLSPFLMDTCTQADNTQPIAERIIVYKICKLILLVIVFPNEFCCC